MTVASSSTLDETRVKLTRTLSTQLEQIGDTHGGKVPLHGRLFAQWLHYVFPRECVFPHKSGTASLASPHEFGDYIASVQEMKAHAAGANASEKVSAPKPDELEWMAQWSSEEELFTKDSALQAPWEYNPLVIGGAVLFVIA